MNTKRPNFTLVMAALVCSWVLSACDQHSGSAPPRAKPAQVTVFAAASLTDVLAELGKRYEKQTGGQAAVRFSFASSGTLAKQIEAGAPADMFISANTQWMDYLTHKELIDPATRQNLVCNQLVLVASQGTTAPTPLVKGAMPADWAKARWAMGDPAHVPAGQYARQALHWLGWWDQVSPRTVTGVDVRAALRYVAMGEARFGIVFATDAQASTRVDVVGVFAPESHTPIVYPMALLKNAPAAARAWLDYLRSDAAHTMFLVAGFVLPEMEKDAKR